MSSNNGHDNLILKAELTDDKQIKITWGSKHFPMLSYALRLLDVELDTMIFNHNVQEKIKASGGIVVPDSNDIIKRANGRL